MEKMLKQDEIDALFEAARTQTAQSERGDASKDRVAPYSFATAGQISTEQLRAISMLNDLFARNLTHNLAASLRTRFQVNLVSAEQIPFNEFMLRIPEISYVASVRLEPLGAVSVLQLEMSLVPPIVDLLLGGEGREGSLRELTDIEESILGSVVEIICRELTSAWQPVDLSFSFERRQMLTQVARLISVNERTLCLSFEIRMPHSSGLLNLAFPAVVSNTILRRLTVEFVRGSRHAAEMRGRMEERARLIRFGTSLQLRSVRVPAEAIESLAVGSVLRLDLPVREKPLWCAGGQVLSPAQPVRQGVYRAARLESFAPRGVEA